jgi:hypothetical protein
MVLLSYYGPNNNGAIIVMTGLVESNASRTAYAAGINIANSFNNSRQNITRR